MSDPERYRSAIREELPTPNPNKRDEDLRPLTDDECLLCLPTMKGFDLQDKKWRKTMHIMYRGIRY